MHVEVLDHGVGQQGLSRFADRVEQDVVDLAVDEKLEPLALSDTANPGETEPRQRVGHGLTLAIIDLRLQHDVNDDALVRRPTRALPAHCRNSGHIPAVVVLVLTIRAYPAFASE